jgi:hypothetical protein
MSDMALKWLRWWVTGHCKGTLTGDKALKRLWWWMTGHCKGYDDGWWVTCHYKGYYDISLQRLRWWVLGALKRLLWRVTAKTTMMGNGALKKATVMGDVSLQRLRWRVTEHWKGYDDRWQVTEKAIMMDDGSLKKLLWRVTEKATLAGNWKGCFDG